MRVDHLVYATPDLQLGIDQVERVLGIRAAPGGRHPGWGTRNALIALGESVYLEIIGPDPEQPDRRGRRVFDVDGLEHPRLVTWAAKGERLEQTVRTAADAGIDLGEVLDGHRARPDGTVLSWCLTDPFSTGSDGLRPFLIDWGTSPHPAETAPSGCSLSGLRGVHPESKRVKATLSLLGLDLDVEPGPTPALIATIDSPRGVVDLT